MNVTTNKTKANILRAGIKALNGKFFSVDFVKKDGTPRTMTCRTGVKKYVKNTQPSTTAKRKSTLKDRGLMGVFEINTGNYKTLNLNTVSRITCGDTVVFNG